MEKPFEPPKTDAEFEERANKISKEGVVPLLNALRNRRAMAVKNIDQEILFLKKIAEHKGVKL